MEHSIIEAVDIAIKEMSDSFCIKPFLVGNQAEVRDMCITEYNEEEVMAALREEFREDAIDSVADETLDAIDYLNNGAKTIEDLVEKGISEKIAQKVLNKYVK